MFKSKLIGNTLSQNSFKSILFVVGFSLLHIYFIGELIRSSTALSPFLRYLYGIIAVLILFFVCFWLFSVLNKAKKILRLLDNNLPKSSEHFRLNSFMGTSIEDVETILTSFSDQLNVSQGHLNREQTLRKKLEVLIQNQSQYNQLLFELIKLSLENTSLEEMLNSALKLILGSTSTKLDNKGGIFLRDFDKDHVNLIVHLNLPDGLISSCSQVDIGHCLCGKAATFERIPLEDSISNNECCDKIHDFNPITIPIIANLENIGVLFFCVPQGVSLDKEEEAFFRTSSEVLAVMIERKRAEFLLHNSLEEKEVLLREVHHRVKNNMQIISSLLKLQAGYLNSPELATILDDSHSRIQAMSLIHEKLYREADLSRIQFGSYVNALIQSLLSMANLRIRVNFECGIDNIDLDINKAVPCGLILNELISNTLKHAFKDRDRGNVVIQMVMKDANRCSLTFQDDGIGFSPEKFYKSSDSLGLLLIKSLIEDLLDGVIELEANNGTHYKLEFNLD